MAPPEDDQHEERTGVTLSPRLVAGLVLGAALGMLIAQNTRSTKVEWLTFETEQPLWVVLLVTAAALVIAELVGGARRRRRRRAGKG